MDWTTNELRNSLRSIDERIVESNPRKFNLEAAELTKRKAFITSTRQTVKDMKERMSSPAAASKQVLLGECGAKGPVGQPGLDKYRRLDQQLQNVNSQFIDEQQVQQQLMAEQQDEQLELVSGTIGVLKNMSERIGMELDEQAVMLDDFSHEVDNTQSRLDNVMKKLAKVSRMTSVVRYWSVAWHPLRHSPPFLHPLMLPPVNTKLILTLSPLDWTLLDWTGLDSTGLDLNGLYWTGLD
ncbi:putative syntaxin-6 [Scophthalmus maximus]|uniref:Putative syntaxin-6 n=1 Tax=Scophthalmus maximus TaxID=52904 RepID=A0A2U9C1B3_SCOMX|nr:putative syntaxin-6 [Scophthalmus maximus]